MKRLLLILFLSLLWLGPFYASSYSNGTPKELSVTDSISGFCTNTVIMYDGKHRTIMYESIYEPLVEPNYIIFGYDGAFIRKFEHFGGTLFGAYRRNNTHDTIFVEIKGALSRDFEFIDISQLEIKSEFIYALREDTLVELENNSMAIYENETSLKEHKVLPESIKGYNELLEMGIKFSNHEYNYVYPNPRPSWWK